MILFCVFIFARCKQHNLHFSARADKDIISICGKLQVLDQVRVPQSGRAEPAVCCKFLYFRCSTN